MDFDPDAYLAQKVGNTPASAPNAPPAFDPDAYLSQKMGGKPSAPTPEQEHEANVAKYADDAKKFHNEFPLESALPSLQLPIISDIAKKGSAFVSSLVPGSEDKYGATQGERYKNISARQDAIERERKARQSGLSSALETAGNVAGSVALTPALGIEAAATRILPNLAGRVLGAAGEGAAYSTAEHLASAPAEKSVGKTLSELPGAAAQGALFGAAAVPVGAAIGKVGEKSKSAYNFLFNPEEYAAQKLAIAAREAAPNAPGLKTGEAGYLAGVGAPVSVADVRGVKPVIEKAASISPESQHLAEINQSLKDRLQESSQTFQNILDNSYSSLVGKANAKIDPVAVKREARDEAISVNKPAYTAAYSAPAAQNMWTPELQNFVNTEAGQKAVKFAVENSKLSAFAKGNTPQRNPFIKDDNGIYVLNPRSAPPNLEFWDQAKRGLNDQVSSLYRSGDNGAAKVARDAQETFTQHLKDVVPQYQNALSGAKRYIDQDNAFDAGMDFFRLADTSTKTDPLKLRKQIEYFQTPTNQGGYTQKEKEMFNQGLISYIKDNPIQAAKVFSKADAVTMNNLSSVMEPELLKAAYTASQVSRLSALTQEIKVKESKGLIKKLGAGAGLFFLALAEHPIESIQYLFQSPLTSAGTTLGGLALLGGKFGYNKLQIARANRILEMASSTDPRIIKKLHSDVLGNPEEQNLLQNMETGLQRWVLYSRENAGGLARYMGTVAGQASGGRIERKSGGRISPASKADRLILAAEKAKKYINKHTEALLNEPDATIVHALSIAKKAI